MRISLIQLNVIDGDVRRNIGKGLKMLLRAVKDADIIVFPELWTTGYDREAIQRYAESVEEGWSINLLTSIAAEYGVFIISTIPLKEEDGLYDASVLLGPSGVIGIYKKLHLFRPYHEDKIFKYGDRLGLFDTHYGKIGVAICYDLRFPELFRILAKGGARMIFVPASWGAPRAIQWRALLRARAAENEVFIAGVNRVGKSRVTHEGYNGDSSVYDPFGYEIVHSEGNEQVLTAEIDLRNVDIVRQQLPLWRDRRLDKYGIRSDWGLSD